MEIIQNILAFILAIAILVTIHEFGHFWVAKKLGIKILRFSVGFGKPLWSKRYGKDDTEFTVAAIPLGGYVKMLDEREGVVAPYQRHRAFNTQPVLNRIAVVVAGPLFNFLFAIFAYWLMFVIGVSGAKPLIGEVKENTPAAIAGIESGYEILGVEGDKTPTWSAFVQKCINKIVDGEAFDLLVKDQNGYEKTLQMDLSAIQIDDLSKGNLLTRLGFSPKRFPLDPIIDQVVSNSAAEKAGVKSGDEIISADGTPIGTWMDWVKYVQARPAVKIKTEILRDQQQLFLQLIPDRFEQNDKIVGRIGATVQIKKLDDAFVGIDKYGPIAAVTQGIKKTWEMSGLTLKLMGKMIMGEASVKNLSGPISIAQYAGQSATIGLTAFLSFLAIVSVSLGVLNLLPIPILDGGHLLYYIIELLIGKPVSESVQIVGQNIGIVLLVAMMSVAFYNDIARIFS
ncbi:MAG: RIP metalloprotease RseP [Gammaproteobacteria bacterium]